MEKNNLTITLNVLYANKENIHPAYVSKYNSNREKQVILLMINNREKWHYPAVKTISIIKRNNFLATEKSLELHKYESM